MRMARGAQLVDLNRDGLLDLVVVNRNEPAELWRNSGPSVGHWIEVSLHQPGPNSDAIGAKIQLKYDESHWSREVLVGGGHVSGSLGVQHFGLGAAEKVEVRVLWPDGTEGGWETLASDGFWLVSKDRPAESLAR